MLDRLLWKSGAPATDASNRRPEPRPQSQTMTQQLPSQPGLSPQFCFSSGTLRGFLRLSRSSIDDSITQHLNALVTPSETGFDPQSTSQRASTTPAHQPSAQACQSFKGKVLFTAWQARAEVLNYCGIVATSPDPDDPEASLRELESQRDRERVVDERLDPYSARFFPREARTQTLAMLIRQERGVENIVRSRTWDVIQERCAAPHERWEDAFGRWSNQQAATRPGPVRR